MVESLPLVTVTGITGYLGCWAGLLLLQSGKYRVRGTVRSKTNAAKIDPLRKSYGDHFEQLELVEADLLDNESIGCAIQGSTYVLHIASPFIIEQPRHEDELIRPAVDGTLSVLRACHAANVRRVSITSSMAAISQNARETQPDVLDESCWSDPEYAYIGAYEKSKTLAERAAWDFHSKLPEAERFGLTVVNPAWIIGPTLVKTEFASGKVVNMFMQNNLPGGIPQIMFGCVDVRDVAQAHINCIEREEAQGKRFVCCNEELWMREIAAILRNHYTQFGYPIPEHEARYCLIKFVSFFRSDAAKIAQYWGRAVRQSNARSRDVLGLEYRAANDSFKEMVDSMIDQGLLEDRRPR